MPRNNDDNNNNYEISKLKLAIIKSELYYVFWKAAVFYLQSRTKLMKQYQEIKQNWTRRENLLSVFVQFLTTSTTIFFLERRLSFRLCFHPVQLLPIIFEFLKTLSCKLLGNSWGNSYTKVFVLDFHYVESILIRSYSGSHFPALGPE